MPGQGDLFLIQIEIEGLGKINRIGSGQKGVMIYLEEVKNLFDVMFGGIIIRLRTEGQNAVSMPGGKTEWWREDWRSGCSASARAPKILLTFLRELFLRLLAVAIWKD